MNNKIFKLARYFYKNSPSDRSHFYRFKNLLDQKCSEIISNDWLTTKDQLDLCKQLSIFAPIKEMDLETKSLQKIYKKWHRRLPQDKKFYKMALEQNKLWKKFGSQNLQAFLESAEGKNWFKERSKLKRKAFFELDRSYKKSKGSAKNYEQRIHALIRANPLLRWEDLRSMGIKNAQFIYQNFKARKYYQHVFLLNLKSQIAVEEVGQKKR